MNENYGRVAESKINEMIWKEDSWSTGKNIQWKKIREYEDFTLSLKIFDGTMHEFDEKFEIQMVKITAYSTLRVTVKGQRCGTITFEDFQKDFKYKTVDKKKFIVSKTAHKKILEGFMEEENKKNIIKRNKKRSDDEVQLANKKAIEEMKKRQKLENENTELKNENAELKNENKQKDANYEVMVKKYENELMTIKQKEADTILTLNFVMNNLVAIGEAYIKFKAKKLFNKNLTNKDFEKEVIQYIEKRRK